MYLLRSIDLRSVTIILERVNDIVDTLDDLFSRNKFGKTREGLKILGEFSKIHRSSLLSWYSCRTTCIQRHLVISLFHRWFLLGWNQCSHVDLHTMRTNDVVLRATPNLGGKEGSTAWAGNGRGGEKRDEVRSIETCLSEYVLGPICWLDLSLDDVSRRDVTRSATLLRHSDHWPLSSQSSRSYDTRNTQLHLWRHDLPHMRAITSSPSITPSL